MRLALFGYDSTKGNSAKTLIVKKKLEKVIKNSNHLCLDQKNPEIVISIGGDGTFLSAFHHYNNLIDKVHFIGFDTGHLGFYTDWEGNQLPQFINSLIHHANYKNVSYALLHAHVNYAGNKKPDNFLALNESTIKRTDGSTMIAKLYNNDDKDAFEEFRGDGFCISTPTGSTAYNKSIGGSILCPDLNAIELTGIAPINSTKFPSLSSPMTISANDKFTIVPKDCYHNSVTFDDQSLRQPVKSVVFQVSKHRIHFVKYHHIGFWTKVSHAFVKA